VNKRVIAIAVAAAVVVTGLWYVFIFTSQTHAIHKANLQASALHSQAASLRSQIAVLQQEQTQLPQATAKLSTLQLALPNTPVLDKLIDDINADATTSGVDWQNISPTKPATYAAGSAQAVASGFPGGMQSVSVVLGVNGNYKQILDFVTGLNAMPRLIDVGSINITGVGGTVKSSAQISTQIFFVPPAAGSTAATANTVTP
jgi:Tfp pilus assembly protein PilO